MMAAALENNMGAGSLATLLWLLVAGFGLTLMPESAWSRDQQPPVMAGSNSLPILLSISSSELYLMQIQNWTHQWLAQFYVSEIGY